MNIRCVVSHQAARKANEVLKATWFLRTQFATPAPTLTSSLSFFVRAEQGSEGLDHMLNMCFLRETCSGALNCIFSFAG